MAVTFFLRHPVRISLSPFSSRLTTTIGFLLLSVNCSTYLFRQRFYSRLTELQHSINLIYFHNIIFYCCHT